MFTCLEAEDEDGKGLFLAGLMSLMSMSCRCLTRLCCKGASMYDVRTEGGGGFSPKEDVVREVA